ncbi:unnamed protein product [Closterium sp. Naga37s-1]|nr:unnamed protein product [Closterium sp. Naga37s-1]
MGDSKLAAAALLVVAILIGMRLFSLASPPLPPPRCSFVTTASTTVSTTASTSMGDSKPATALPYLHAPISYRSSHVPSPRPNNPAPRGPSPHPNNPAPRVPSPCPNNTAPRVPSPPLFPCDAPPVCVSSVSEINASVKSIGDDLRVHSRLPPMRPSHAPLIPFPLHACVSSTTKMGASVKQYHQDKATKTFTASASPISFLFPPHLALQRHCPAESHSTTPR